MPLSDKTAAVILAAGFSSRMKVFKPLMKLGERRVLDRVVDLYRRAGIADIRVVAATVGEDEHSVGLHEILDIKHGGIEKYGFQCQDLGTSVSLERLLDVAEKPACLAKHPVVEFEHQRAVLGLRLADDGVDDDLTGGLWGPGHGHGRRLGDGGHRLGHRGDRLHTLGHHVDLRQLVQAEQVSLRQHAAGEGQHQGDYDD